MSEYQPQDEIRAPEDRVKEGDSVIAGCIPAGNRRNTQKGKKSGPSSAARTYQRRTIFPAVTILALCLLLPLFVSIYHIPNTFINLTVEVAAIEMKVAEEWKGARNLLVSSVLLAGMTSLECSCINSQITSLEENTWAEIIGPNIVLSYLTLGQEGVLRIERDGCGFLQLYSRSGHLSGALETPNALQLVAGTQGDRSTPDLSYQFDDKIPETVLFSSTGYDLIPARLSLRHKRDFVMRNIHVHDRLVFGWNISEYPGEVSFSSTINKGNLVIIDTKKTIALNKGDRLVLNQIDGWIKEIVVNDQIRVHFQGKASQIYLGHPGFVQNLSPTLLQYLYLNEIIVLFFSASGYTWILLWAILDLYRFIDKE